MDTFGAVDGSLGASSDSLGPGMGLFGAVMGSRGTDLEAYEHMYIQVQYINTHTRIIAYNNTALVH